MARVDLLAKWAAPELKSHEVLLLLALFERARGRVDQCTADPGLEWP